MPKRIPRYVKTHPKSLLVVLVMAATVLVSYALVSVALTTRAENARKDRVQLCRLQNESNRVLRSILVLARETALGPDQRLTPVQQQFYTRAFELIDTADCAEFGKD